MALKLLQRDGLSGLISIYLDLFRLLAAAGVFLSHVQQHSASPGVLPKIYFDHQLVIIFFVISGYVIAASALRPGRTLSNYGTDRLARLSSVVIPALLLTYCLDTIGSMVSPEIYSFVNPQHQSVRLLANLFYWNQIWFFSIVPSSNTLFWSLGYEFWYYALFGVWFFVHSKRTKIMLLFLISLFIGPKILLLLPAWAFGATAFLARKVYNCSFRTNLLLFVATGLGLVGALLFQDQLGLNNCKAGLPPLYYSSNFIGDNIFAFIVASHFFCCGILSRHFTANLEHYKAVKFIRWAASRTFSLYLFHMPILFFIRAITKYDPHNIFAVLLAMGVALLIVVGLSKITEDRRPAIRAIFRNWMETFTGKWRQIAGSGKSHVRPRENISCSRQAFCDQVESFGRPRTRE